MICPKCGTRNRPVERICIRCKYFPELDESVQVVPPRAGRFGRFPSHIRNYRLRRLRRVRTHTWLRPGGARWPFQFLLSIVPGLGHLVGKRYLLSATYAAVIVTLFLCGIELKGRLGQVLIGLAAGIHAQSMLSTLHLQFRDDTIKRILLTGGLLVFLMMAIYQPAAERMAWSDASLQRVVRVTNQQVERYYMVQGIDALIVSVMAFLLLSVVAWFIALAVSAFWGERKRRNG